MNEISLNQQNKRRGLRLSFPLACALLLGWLLVSAPRHQSTSANGAKINLSRAVAEEAAALAPPQIFGAELNGVCPSGCSVPITINSVENLLTTDGRKVKVNFQVGQIPGDLKVSGVSASAQVTLDNNKVLEGVASAGVSSSSVTIAVKGGLLNLNKGRREEVKKTKVTVTVISNLKSGLGRAQNIETRVADGGEDVSWDFTKLPCDTAKEFEVEVKLKPFTVTGNRGKERVLISARKVFVRIIGSNLRPGVRDIVATVTPIGRSSIICSATKTFN
ncbi:MAG: hypothetical protein AB7U82_17745 [Blastocatellales bacterium]